MLRKTKMQSYMVVRTMMIKSRVAETVTAAIVPGVQVSFIDGVGFVRRSQHIRR